MLSDPEDLRAKAQEMLGMLIKMKRKEHGMTQEELGVHVDYSPHAAKQAISQIERGVTWIPVKKLSQFVSTLNLDEDFMKLLNYQYHSRNFAESIKIMKAQKAKEIRNRGDDLESQSAVSRPAPKMGKDDLEEKLVALKEMFEKGLIEEDEFKQMKGEILKKFVG